MISRHDAEVPRQFERASAVFEGQVVSAESFITSAGNIETRYSIRVDQPYKGTVPGVVSLTLPGGVVGSVGEAVGCQPKAGHRQEQTLLLSETADGSLFPVAGCASAVRTGGAGFAEALGEVQLLSLISGEPASQNPAGG